MSGSRWVIIPSRLSGSWRYFLYSSSLYSYHLFLISFSFLKSIPFLSFTEPIFALNIPFESLIFLKRSPVSHSTVFFYFFVLTSEEGFLTSPCSSLELCIQMGIFFPFSFAFHISLSLFFFLTANCKASSESHFDFLHFSFLGMILLPILCSVLQISIHSSSFTLSDLVP